MLYDLSFVWAWLGFPLMIGGVVGWTTNASGAQRRWAFGGLAFALVAFVAGVVAASRRWLPGRAGFWLETALFFFASYVVGCLVGAVLKSVARRTPPGSKPRRGRFPPTSAPQPRP
jgi:FtsH-binding integral membrane protein